MSNTSADTSANPTADTSVIVNPPADTSANPPANPSPDTSPDTSPDASHKTSHEISHALFIDLTEPQNPKEYAVSNLSKQLIKWVGLDVVRFCRNQQVGYRVVDHCRETYDRIIVAIEAIDQSPDNDISYDKFTRYTDAVDALEEYLFKLLLNSEAETQHYLATTKSINDCIAGSITWVNNRKALRDVASEFHAQDKLLAMFDQGKNTEVENGLRDAAWDDDRAYFMDLHARIENHALVGKDTQKAYDLNSAVETLIGQTITAIRTLGDAIGGENDMQKKAQRQTLCIQFLFVLHGVLEIVIDTSEQVNGDWKAHLKSREVWTAAKLVAEHLNRADSQYEQHASWQATYDDFIEVISHQTGVRVPTNWLKLVKLSAKIHRPYLSRAWAVVALSNKLIQLFNDKGNCLLRNVDPLERTFDKAISVLEQASESWKETKRYDWNSYETYAGVVAAFQDLERDIEQRYTMFQAADQWGNDKDILNKAIAKDKARVEATNARFDKLSGGEQPPEGNRLITVKIKSSVDGVKETTMQVSHTTRLAAIRYGLSRQISVETDRKKVVTNGRFEHGHTMDQDIQSICKGAENCQLSFVLESN